MIQEESIQIGAFRLRTENYQEEGIFTSASNEEMKGVSYSFILDGASNYSFVIKLIQFEDSTASVGLDGLYTGPRFIYSNLYSRLRLGISTNNHISSGEVISLWKKISIIYLNQLVDPPPPVGAVWLRSFVIIFINGPPSFVPQRRDDLVVQNWINTGKIYKSSLFLLSDMVNPVTKF